MALTLKEQRQRVKSASPGQWRIGLSQQLYCTSLELEVVYLSVCFSCFPDGLGDVLSHLRKQVETLFNARYGKMFLNNCS